MSIGYQHPKKKWSQINALIKNNPQTVPQKLVSNGKIITKPVDMANLANKFFTKKVEKIRSKFLLENRDPIDILRALIPRGKSELRIPEITITQTKHLLKTFKSSSSTGYDDLSSRSG